MPIYEYVCQACSQVHEAFQGVNDQPLTTCPACQQPKLTKMISATSFQLKGTGWYATDIRDKGKKPATGDTSSTADNTTSTTPTTNDKATD